VTGKGLDGAMHVIVNGAQHVVDQRLVVSHLKPVDYDKLEARSLSDKAGTVVKINVKPGADNLGIEWDHYTGKVEDVNHSRLAFRMGIRSGWFLKQIDSQYYSAELLDSKRRGTADYVVVFSRLPYNMCCADGHLIVQRKDAAKWYHSRKTCAICGCDIEKKDARFRCAEKCDHSVCEIVLLLSAGKSEAEARFGCLLLPELCNYHLQLKAACGQ